MPLRRGTHKNVFRQKWKRGRKKGTKCLIVRSLIARRPKVRREDKGGEGGGGRGEGRRGGRAMNSKCTCGLKGANAEGTRKRWAGKKKREKRKRLGEAPRNNEPFRRIKDAFVGWKASARIDTDTKRGFGATEQRGKKGGTRRA